MQSTSNIGRCARDPISKSMNAGINNNGGLPSIIHTVCFESLPSKDSEHRHSHYRRVTVCVYKASVFLRSEILGHVLDSDVGWRHPANLLRSIPIKQNLDKKIRCNQTRDSNKTLSKNIDKKHTQTRFKPFEHCCTTIFLRLTKSLISYWAKMTSVTSSVEKLISSLVGILKDILNSILALFGAFTATAKTAVFSAFDLFNAILTFLISMYSTDCYSHVLLCPSGCHFQPLPNFELKWTPMLMCGVCASRQYLPHASHRSRILRL